MAKSLKATFTYLTRSDWRTFFQLIHSIFLLKKNCRWGRKYDITVFHEKTYKVIFIIIIKLVFNKVKFVKIDLETPNNFRNIQYHELTKDFGEGYRNMCRFFNSEFYKYLDKYDWYCRLDTDSFLIGKNHYDFFQFMDSANLQYGYIAEVLDSPDVTLNLGDFMNNYSALGKLNFSNRELLFDTSDNYTNRVFYTNFEVINLNFFRNYEVQNVLKQIDESGNIYKYRWGDAPLRTFLINAFLSKDEIVRFDDICYKHYPFMQNHNVITCDFTPKDWISNKKWLGTLKSDF